MLLTHAASSSFPRMLGCEGTRPARLSGTSTLLAARLGAAPAHGLVCPVDDLAAGRIVEKQGKRPAVRTASCREAPPSGRRSLDRLMQRRERVGGGQTPKAHPTREQAEAATRALAWRWPEHVCVCVYKYLRYSPPGPRLIYIICGPCRDGVIPLVVTTHEPRPTTPASPFATQLPGQGSRETEHVAAPTSESINAKLHERKPPTER
ncbi:hypothetical protein CDD83_562 [Cordyceps sp. RAO-2017]|nr:hypothetical protein CDD83_562 [Cordyceps sp. RAO-2017]